MLSVAALLPSYAPLTPVNSRVAPMRADVRMAAENTDSWKAAGLAAALALATGVQSASAGPFTRSEIASLTYEQIKGTGLANTCPKVEGGGATSISLASGKKYKIDEFCLEPTSFQVLEEKLTKSGLVTEPVNTKVTTRQTYVLTGIEGDLVQDAGKLAFVEQDGIDYAPTTVQLPGGERVPFLFTVKNLVAKSDVATNKIDPGLKLAGSFKVPSYRTGLFLDPKGRGTTTGYDQAVAPSSTSSPRTPTWAPRPPRMSSSRATSSPPLTSSKPAATAFASVNLQARGIMSAQPVAVHREGERRQ